MNNQKTVVVLFLFLTAPLYAMKRSPSRAELTTPKQKVQKTYIGNLIAANKLNKQKNLTQLGRAFLLHLEKVDLENLDGLHELIPRKDWPRVTFINLAHNKFTHIPKELVELIAQANNLTTLMLNDNALIALPEDFLVCNPNLKTVDLHNNKLHNLPYGFLACSRDLTSVRLDGNPIEESLKKNNYKITTQLPQWIVKPLQGTPAQEQPTIDPSQIPGYIPPAEDDEGYGTEPETDE